MPIRVKVNNDWIEVTAQPSTTTPKANGIANIGSETTFARGDHIHPLQVNISGNAATATLADNSTKWGGSNKTISTSTPSSGSDGDIWFQIMS